MNVRSIRSAGLALIAFFAGALHAGAQDIGKLKSLVFSDSPTSPSMLAPTGVTGILVNQLAMAAGGDEALRAKLDQTYGNNPSADLLELSPALTPANFSVESRDFLAARFAADPSRDSLLLAYLAGAKVEADVRKYAAEDIKTPGTGMLHATLSWAANLALARQGDGDAIAKLLDSARSMDAHAQVVFVLQDLAYAPRPEIAQYIAGFAVSDIRLDTIKPNVAGTLTANYAAAALARMLADFPVAYKDDHSYSDAEIAAVRKWLAGRKEWNFRTGKK